jgi:hypothetical protein
MDTGRLESFSDGVFAVAITLLVFGSAYRRLAPRWPTSCAARRDCMLDV